MISSIKVSPVNGLNRDKVEKQVGHKLVINFKQPIVNDGIEYLTDKKADGYNVVKGKKRLDVGEMKIHTGGRGKKQKDITTALMKNYETAKKSTGLSSNNEFKGETNRYAPFSSATVE